MKSNNQNEVNVWSRLLNAITLRAGRANTPQPSLQPQAIQAQGNNEARALPEVKVIKDSKPVISIAAPRLATDINIHNLLNAKTDIIAPEKWRSHLLKDFSAVYGNYYIEKEQYKISNNHEKLYQQVLALEEHMQKLGFKNFKNLSTKFTPQTENYHESQISLLSNLKESLESIVYLIDTSSEEKRKKLVNLYKDIQVECGAGTLTKLQEMLNSIQATNINNYLTNARLSIIDNIAMHLFKENANALQQKKKRLLFTQKSYDTYGTYGTYETYSRYIGDGPAYEVHDVKSLTNSVAEPFKLIKKDSKDDPYLIQNIDPRDKNLFTKKINQSFSDINTIGTMVNAVTMTIISTLPEADKNNVIPNEQIGIIEQYLKAINLDSYLSPQLITEVNNTDYTTIYKKNYEDFIKDAVYKYLDFKGVVKLAPEHVKFMEIKKNIETNPSKELINLPEKNNVPTITISAEELDNIIAQNPNFTGQIYKYLIENNIILYAYKDNRYIYIDPIEIIIQNDIQIPVHGQLIPATDYLLENNLDKIKKFFTENADLAFKNYSLSEEVFKRAFKNNAEMLYFAVKNDLMIQEKSGSVRTLDYIKKNIKYIDDNNIILFILNTDITNEEKSKLLKSCSEDRAELIIRNAIRRLKLLPKDASATRDFIMFFDPSMTLSAALANQDLTIDEASNLKQSSNIVDYILSNDSFLSDLTFDDDDNLSLEDKRLRAMLMFDKALLEDNCFYRDSCFSTIDKEDEQARRNYLKALFFVNKEQTTKANANLWKVIYENGKKYDAFCDGLEEAAEKDRDILRIFLGYPDLMAMHNPIALLIKQIEDLEKASDEDQNLLNNSIRTLVNKISKSQNKKLSKGQRWAQEQEEYLFDLLLDNPAIRKLKISKQLETKLYENAKDGALYLKLKNGPADILQDFLLINPEELRNNNSDKKRNEILQASSEYLINKMPQLENQADKALLDIITQNSDSMMQFINSYEKMQANGEIDITNKSGLDLLWETVSDDTFWDTPEEKKQAKKNIVNFLKEQCQSAKKYFILSDNTINSIIQSGRWARWELVWLKTGVKYYFSTRLPNNLQQIKELSLSTLFLQDKKVEELLKGDRYRFSDALNCMFDSAEKKLCKSAKKSFFGKITSKLVRIKHRKLFNAAKKELIDINENYNNARKAYKTERTKYYEELQRNAIAQKGSDIRGHLKQPAPIAGSLSAGQKPPKDCGTVQVR
jgi:hypothetical protein